MLLRFQRAMHLSTTSTSTSLFFLTSLLSITTALPFLPKPQPHLLPRQNSTSVVPLSNGAPVLRAGTTLNAAAAAEANPRDDTATRAFTSTPIKTSAGQCLSIDPAAGDFRENLIPVALQACDGSAGQNFDVITAGKHIQATGGALVVSSLTQGCLNFDPRRAAGDTVVLFSCGGRADGEGQTTDSQIFAFDGSNELELSLLSENGQTCLAPQGGKLGSGACGGEKFTIG